VGAAACTTWEESKLPGSRFKARRIVFALVILLVGLAAAGADAASGATQKSSLLSCGGTTEKPFTQWGDYANYTLVPNGGLEQGAQGWKLTGGARVVSGNESFQVHSAADRYSLLLPAGSSATTPMTCAALLDPTLRYFSKRDAGGGNLKVEVVYRGLLGWTFAHELLLGGSGTSSEWAPSSPSLFLANITGLLALKGTTVQVSFRFTPRSGSTFRLDDVYVDPLKII
jgi:hypothetical protein